MNEFSQSWSESAWQPRDTPNRAGYMWPLDNAGWKSRMQAFRTIVGGGADALDDLQQLLTDDIRAKRVLAAPSPFVEGVLRVSRLDRFFKLTGSVSEAVDIFCQDQEPGRVRSA